ncbi:MAG TPA: DinB family protein [Methylomirabilota bacterium]|nr:DinB family protein [Methylomirabilota bacterium]
MDALGLFMLRYDGIHVGFVEELFKNATDAQLRQRPHGANPVVWLVWHATRVEDAVVNRLVADRPQVLEEGDWNRRMGVTRRDVGPGMTVEEVEALSARIDVPALRAYHAAVAAGTKAIASSLPPAGWDEIVPAERVREIVARDGLLIEAGRWVEEFWATGRPRGWYLLQVGLLHPYGHWFDAMVTRGLLGVAP